jgi:hypothetical protein
MALETWKTEATPVFHNVENGSPIKHVHPFLDTGAHVYRGPVFHHLFTTLAPVFCLETVYTHTQTSGNVLSKSGVRLALAAPV